MITDDEVMRLFEEADPARAIDTAPARDAATFLDALPSPTDVHIVKIGPTSDPRPSHRGRRAAAAVAAVTVLVLGVVALAGRDDDGASPELRATTTPTTDVRVPDPAIKAFQDQLSSICHAAYQRLESEGPQDGAAPFEAMAHVLEETLPELRELVPPDRVRDWWESAYGNLEQLIVAWRDNPRYDGVADIIHDIETNYGLVQECTLGSPR